MDVILNRPHDAGTEDADPFSYENRATDVQARRMEERGGCENRAKFENKADHTETETMPPWEQLTLF